MNRAFATKFVLSIVLIGTSLVVPAQIRVAFQTFDVDSANTWDFTSVASGSSCPMTTLMDTAVPNNFAAFIPYSPPIYNGDTVLVWTDIINGCGGTQIDTIWMDEVIVSNFSGLATSFIYQADFSQTSSLLSVQHWINGVAQGYDTLAYGNVKAVGTYNATLPSTTDTFQLELVLRSSEGVTFLDSFIISANSALPVTWLKQSAEYINGVPHINWSTASEVNNDRFEIERSLDGVHFTSIGSINGSGNSSTISHYEYIDQNFSDRASSRVYYRVAQIDYDGTTSTNHVMSVKIPTEINVFPNPVNSNVFCLTLYDQAREVFTLSVTDCSGNLVYRRAGSVPLHEQISCDLPQHLSKGLYYLNLEVGSNIHHRLLLLE